MNRAEALKVGAKTYQGGPCSKCGGTERYTSSYNCKPCGVARANADPEAKREAMREHRQANPEIYRERDRARHGDARRAASLATYYKNPEKARAGQLKRMYGLTPEAWDGMFAKQAGTCAICSDDLRRGTGGAAVDHCHKTGRVRALLCAPCNTAIGLLKEDPAVLDAAKAYLNLHRSTDDQRAEECQ